MPTKVLLWLSRLFLECERRLGAETDAGDEGMSKNTNPHWGSTLDDFLKEEGVYQTTKTTAVMRVVAWQLAQEMERLEISKTDLAARMHTSRAQLDRILKAESNVTAGNPATRRRSRRA